MNAKLWVFFLTRFFHSEGDSRKINGSMTKKFFRAMDQWPRGFFQKHHSCDCCKISRLNVHNVSNQDQGAKTEAAWQLLEGLVNALSLVSWVSTSLHKSLYSRYDNHKYIAFVFSGMMGTCFPKMGNAAVLELPLARAVSVWNSGKHADVTKGAEQVITDIFISPPQIIMIMINTQVRRKRWKLHKDGQLCSTWLPETQLVNNILTRSPSQGPDFSLGLFKMIKFLLLGQEPKLNIFSTWHWIVVQVFKEG